MNPLLFELLNKMEKAKQQLVYSYELCLYLNLQNLSQVELDHLEALTARFARFSDMLVQKVFRTIDQIELEDEGSVRDRIYRAEKKGLIANADDLIGIRLLRNEISHDYTSDHIIEIYRKVLDLTPILIDYNDKIMRYCKKFNY